VKSEEVLSSVHFKGNGGDGGDAVDSRVRVACKALHLDLARFRHTGLCEQASEQLVNFALLTS
jgi:hypothetical protein